MKGMIANLSALKCSDSSAVLRRFSESSTGGRHGVGHSDKQLATKSSDIVKTEEVLLSAEQFEVGATSTPTVKTSTPLKRTAETMVTLSEKIHRSAYEYDFRS